MRTRCFIALHMLLFAEIATCLASSPEERSCAISGRARDDRGAPIQAAVVSAFNRSGWQAFASAQPASGAVTNRKGEYCIRELPAGAYLVRAFVRIGPPSASPSCDSCCREEHALTATFHPRSLSREDARAVVVGKSGTASGIDIVMRRVPVYCVRGEVRDAGGKLRSDVAIGVEGDGWSAGVLNEGGRFLLTQLPEGPYTITVSDQPKLGRALARQTIHVKSKTPAIRVTIPSTMTTR